jgi:hypothetical protein
VRERGPLLSPTRLRTVKAALGLFTRHLGGSFRVSDIDQHRIDTYVHARQTGRLKPDDYRARGKVAPATIRNEVHVLSTVCNWAAAFRPGGKPMLLRNPVQRPEGAGGAEPSPAGRAAGAVRATGGGRRCGGSSVRPVPTDAGTGVAHRSAHQRHSAPDGGRRAARARRAGRGVRGSRQDDDIARAWLGGLRWRAEWDKKGYETFSPLPTALRPLLTAYLRDKGMIGGAWLFPGAGGEPANKARADYLLRKAEKAAGLTRMNPADGTRSGAAGLPCGSRSRCRT